MAVLTSGGGITGLVAPPRPGKVTHVRPVSHDARWGKNSSIGVVSCGNAL